MQTSRLVASPPQASLSPSPSSEYTDSLGPTSAHKKSTTAKIKNQ